MIGRMVRVSGALAMLALAGCAQFSADGGMATVSGSVKQETGKDVAKLASAAETQRARAEIDALVQAPLDVEAAVQIALLNNRGLQAAFNELGISEAAYVQASLPPNPGISLSRLAGGGVVEVEFRLIGNLLALATLPQRSEIAARQFEQAKYRAVEATLRLAVDTRRAWFRAVAASQRAALLEQSRAAADAATRTMIQLGESGAANTLDQSRLAAFYAELSAQLAQARLRARGDREALTRFMGLWGGGLWGGDLDYRLPPQLPALPAEPETRSNVEIEAVRRRVDLVIARQEVATLAKSFKLDEATRYVSLLQLAGIYNGETTNNDVGTFDNVQRLGLDLDVSIPIFDSGEARLRGARETYMRAVNRMAERAINARSEARSAYDAYRSTWDIARFYQSRVLPLRRTISNEVLLRYNGMLVDVFELLIDARERIAASSASLEALRDFYLATADLQAALIVGDPTRNDKGERP